MPSPALDLQRRIVIFAAAVTTRESELVESAEIPEMHHEHHHPGEDRFRKLAGVYVGVAAMLLAIAALGGSKSTKDMLNANIRASDTYAYYQAKYQRQVAYRIAATQLETVLAAAPNMPPETSRRAEAAIASYRKEANRYESDSRKGNGKNELLAKARRWEFRRDQAEARDWNFMLSAALFQIAVLLGSVSIVAASWPLIALSGGLSVFATLLMANGFFLAVSLPFG